MDNLKKIDNRLRVLIENGIISGHRSIFAILGEKAKDQVAILHQMLSRAQVRTRPTVLWCYKKELGFSSHRKKRMRILEKKKKLGLVPNRNDPFEEFISSTTIRYCYYHETQRILGNTYGMLVVQDFEAITPNVLARTVETVEGGGVIVILLNTLQSVEQLSTILMDVHDRYRTESHQHIVPRFNERFILSLASCKTSIAVNDRLDVIPISSHIPEIAPLMKPDAETLSAEQIELKQLQESLADTQPLASLVGCCKTVDQAKAVLKFVDALCEKTLRSTVSLTAARGRGKSAALGIAIAGAVTYNYSNIFVTSPSPENLKTLFEFVLHTFNVLHYQEHLDYEVVRSSNPELNKCVVRINIFRHHRQTIQYIDPAEAVKNKFLSKAAELVVIDEAAAIPLPIVKALLGPYVVFLSSTINGYEGTGRSLSLKLLQQLRQQNVITKSNKQQFESDANVFNRVLHEVTLDESIRYRSNDPVEAWLNQLLCLDATNVPPVPSTGCPQPDECELYYVNRDALFSFHKKSEEFLQRLIALYVSSHYKNSPNDLQMMSDAPAHHLFCLLPPVTKKQRAKQKFPDVLCFVQVCLEGEISKESIMSSLSRGRRAAGDLIPWTISQQFQETQFASLSGARIVRIATNPNYQNMGYGTVALKALESYYKGEISRSMEESQGKNEGVEEGSEKRDGVLLISLNERPAEQLDYMGVSFGLTPDLLRFWKKNGYVPVYLRQTASELTGEHTCIMLKSLHDSSDKSINNWLPNFWVDFQKRFLSLLSFSFRTFSSSLALNIMSNSNAKVNPSSRKVLNKKDLDYSLTLYDLKRLELYSHNMADYHLIVDLLPKLAEFYFLDKFGDDFHLSAAQCAILLSLGFQRKTIDDVVDDLNLPSNQIMGLFIRAIKKITTYLRGMEEKAVEQSLGFSEKKGAEFPEMEPVKMSLEQELREAAEKIENDAKKQFKKISADLRHLEKYAVKGNEDDWDKVLEGDQKSLVTIKSLAPREKQDESLTVDEPSLKRKKFKKAKKKLKQ